MSEKLSPYTESLAWKAVSNLATEAEVLLEEAVASAYRLLKEIDTPSIELATSYRFSRQIAEIGRDFMLLEMEGSFHGSPVLLRSMLEGLFSLRAATYDRLFFARKAASDAKELLNKWIQIDPTDLEEIDDLKQFIQNLEFQHGLTPPHKPLKVYDIARLGGVKELYDSQYRLLCKSTHPSLPGAIQNETRGGLGFRMQTYTMIAAATAASLAQLVPQVTSQSTIDAATEIIRKLTEENSRLLGNSLNSIEAEVKRKTNQERSELY